MRRKKWIVSKGNKDLAAQIAQELSVDPFAALLVTSRGFDNTDDIYEFFDTDAPLTLDPLSIADMEKAAERIKGLQNLVNRAAKYGIRIFLYMNEPRSMEPEWFAASPERAAYAGVEVRGKVGFCSSNPEVLAWLTRSLNSVFTQVKGLGGIFTISASENYTVCASRYKYYKKCQYL